MTFASRIYLPQSDNAFISHKVLTFLENQLPPQNRQLIVLISNSKQ